MHWNIRILRALEEPLKCYDVESRERERERERDKVKSKIYIEICTRLLVFIYIFLDQRTDTDDRL